MKTIKELELAGYTDERIKGYQMAKKDVLGLIDELEKDVCCHDDYVTFPEELKTKILG